MRWPRATTRRLMALVVVSAVFLGGWVEVPKLRGRAEVYRERARVHAAQEWRYQRMLVTEGKRTAYWSALSVEWARRASATGQNSRSVPRPDADDWAFLAEQATLLARCRQERVNRLTTNVGHYARLRRKYEDAAARPWLPVWPDPPPPE